VYGMILKKSNFHLTYTKHIVNCGETLLCEARYNRRYMKKTNNPEEENIEVLIGWRIKKLREAKRMTLATLAEKTGLSKGLLSKIENGLVSSPVSTLSLVAESLQVRLAFLVDRFEEKPQIQYVLTKKNKGTKHDLGTEEFGLYYERLAAKKLNKKMSPSILTVETDKELPVVFTHPGEEFLMVQEGRMELSMGKEKFIMETGDSIYFDADIPHRGRNIEDYPLKVLMVICE